MRKIVNIYQAKTHLSRLVEDVEAGVEVIIARAGTPILRMVKLEDEQPLTRVEESKTDCQSFEVEDLDGPPVRKLGFAAHLFDGYDWDEFEKIDRQYKEMFSQMKFADAHDEAR